MKILLLETGSVAIKLSDKVVKAFEDDGHEVHRFQTDNANGMYVRLTESKKYLKHDIYDETAKYKQTGEVTHISEAEWADVCLLCPADYNTIGKIVAGVADNIVTSTVAAWLGTGKKLYIADAMNVNMFKNPFYQANRKALDALPQVQFIEPTVKKLACGDYGIGGLADIGAIVNIVEGHTWCQPIASDCLIGEFNEKLWEQKVRKFDSPTESFRDYLPRFDEPGAFGAKRKFDRHEGVDIYCDKWSSVHAVEDGEVVDSYQYTGKAAGCEWWNDTWCLKVKGKSGVITYGELEMPNLGFLCYPEIGSKVSAGQMIGAVGSVLPDEKWRRDIRHHNTAMLHMELRKESCHIDGWKLDGDRDPRLLDPTPYLKLKTVKFKSNA